MPPQNAFMIDSVVVANAIREQADLCSPPSKIGQHQPLHYKTRKSVSFHQVVKAKKTIHVNDLSAEELRAYWYKSEDYESMKKDARFEADLLENGCLVEHESSCTVMKRCRRGLDVFTRMGSKQRSETKRRGHAIVMEEQDLQREEGSNDPEYIAEVYASVSKEACAAAIAVAAAK